MDYLSYIFLFILVKCASVESVIVRVNEGQLNGVQVNLSTGLGTYYSFKGIPYAEPPVGKLRFKAPKPHKPWEGVRQATQHGSVCAQVNLLNVTNPFSSEDCLFLNVYSPNLEPEHPLSVIFFIHGGAFRSGSGNDDVYGPDFIVKKNCILVTTNYRLDALGFLNLGTKEVPGNAGLKDQRLALKWVYDNIRNFGGDPEQITVMGQSAGSASVTYHLMSPMSKGLFKRAIALSGVPFCEWALTYKLTNRSFELGKQMGKDTDDPNEMLWHLQSVPALELVGRFPIVIPEETNWNHALKMTAFQPCPEKDFGQERFLVESTIETLKRGNITPADIFIGYTSMEGLLLIPDIISNDLDQKYNNMRELLIHREILLYGEPINTKLFADVIHKQYFGDRAIDKSTMNRFVKYMSDELFVYSVNRFIKHLPCGFKKYLYKFGVETSRNRFSVFGFPFNITGVAHTDDLVYIFSSRIPSGDLLLGDPTNTISELIDRTVTLITNFAKYGNPTPDASLGVVWPEYDSKSKAYLYMNTTLTTGNNVDADVNTFWTHIFEKGGVELP